MSSRENIQNYLLGKSNKLTNYDLEVLNLFFERNNDVKVVIENYKLGIKTDETIKLKLNDYLNSNSEYVRIQSDNIIDPTFIIDSIKKYVKSAPVKDEKIIIQNTLKKITPQLKKLFTINGWKFEQISDFLENEYYIKVTIEDIRSLINSTNKVRGKRKVKEIEQK